MKREEKKKKKEDTMKRKSRMQPKQSRDRGGRQGHLAGAKEAKLSQARLLDVTLENVHLPVKRQRGWRLEPALAGMQEALR